MRLRRQLALVSLIALVIPWATLQALSVFDDLLRENHMAALTATARAVAARLGADEPLLQQAHLSQAPSLPAHRKLYAHPLPAPPLVDGRLDEWRSYPLEPQVFAPDDGPTLTVSAGQFEERLYFAIEVLDAERRFHNPASEQLASGDHLVVFSERAQPGGRYYALRPPLPGPLEAVYRDDNGLVRPDYRIRALWRETKGGYRVELSLPRSLAAANFALAAVDKGTDLQRWAGTIGELAPLVGGEDPGVLPGARGRVVRPSDTLSTAVADFARDGTRISVLDRHGWIRGQAGGIARERPDNHLTGRIVDSLVRDRHNPAWQESRTGRWQASYWRATERGDVGTAWFELNTAEVAAVAVPLRASSAQAEALETRRLGAVIVEQRVEPWRMLDNTAAGRLIVITLGSGAALLIVLVGYASWLSHRIRRLSRAAQRVGEEHSATPQTLAHWPRYRLGDEVAELSEHYRQLLEQRQAHTDYLKTLTGKLSHELRTPLAVVRSSLDNLKVAATAQMPTYVDRAREGCERLSAIVSAMTEASRVEASITQAEFETVDLATLFTDITEAYQSAYPDHRFRLAISPAPANGYRVRVAPELLVQMLDKLVDNAAGFSPREAPIELALALVKDNHQTPHLTLSVSNQGPSLPESLAGRLFQSLTSARDKRAGEQPHLGLGLYIVDLIARHHNGYAQAQNCEHGVRFSVHMPARYPGMSATRY